jgi:F0F1-type ATP synthase beta subunit
MEQHYEQPEQQQQTNDNAKATENNEQPTSTKVPSTGNKVVDVMVGSSLAAWYFMGGDGIQSTISSFFS